MAVQFPPPLLLETKYDPNGEQDVHESLSHCVGAETKGMLKYVGGDGLAINSTFDIFLVTTHLEGLQKPIRRYRQFPDVPG